MRAWSRSCGRSRPARGSPSRPTWHWRSVRGEVRVDLSFVLPGLDPGIHEAARRNTTLQTAFADTHYGLPGQARQRRTRGSVRYGEIAPSYVGNALVQRALDLAAAQHFQRDVAAEAKQRIDRARDP